MLGTTSRVTTLGNFLLVAPGLIVYERLLDAFKGKLSDDGTTRDINTGDLYKNQELFIQKSIAKKFLDFLTHALFERRRSAIK